MPSRSRVLAMMPFVALLSLTACGADPGASGGAADEGPIGTSQSDLISPVIPIHFPLCEADLTVWAQTAQDGWPGFTVKNQGCNNAGAFRIAVLAGSSSYSISVGGLAAGASQWFGVDFDFDCNQVVGVIVDVASVVPESDENNNAITFACPCYAAPYTCAYCNDGACRCGWNTAANLCSSDGGDDPAYGCNQEG